MCSFCNQRSISGELCNITASDVDEAVKTALKSTDCRLGEIAFFGGSFTAIPKEYMLELLNSAYKYVKNKSVSGIRISTRPDAIDDEICKTLKEHGVTSVELGAQSMDDNVLSENFRGHTTYDVIKASEMLKAYGFELGLQMMTGLFASSREKDIFTASQLIQLKPSTVRVYPTVVIENTALAEWFKSGKYIPQSLDEAVDECAEILMMFEDAGIKVIRMGLHSGGNVDDGYLGGAYHPAFRELCQGKIYFNKALAMLKMLPPGNYELHTSDKEISKMIGQKKKNIIALKNYGYNCKIAGEKNLKQYQIIIKDF